MAEIVVPAQVFKQLIIIKIPVITELAEWVSSVAGVVWVSVCSVTCQLLTVVPLPFMSKDLAQGINLRNNFLMALVCKLDLASLFWSLTMALSASNTTEIQ